MRRMRDEHGALSAEFIAAVPLLVLVLAFGWQLLLFVAAGNSAAHAARNGSRAASTDVPVATAVEQGLPNWLRDGHGYTLAEVSEGGVEVEVAVDVPVLFPGLGLGSFDLTRSAELPLTPSGAD